MALSTNASSYALSNYTSSTSSSKSTTSVNASSNALSNYTSMASSSSSSSSKSTSTSVNASSNALSNYTSSSSSSSSAVNKTISAEAWNASATPSSPTPNASSYALSNYTTTTASSSTPAASSSASSSATPNASSNALSNYISMAASQAAASSASSTPTPNASSNALSNYLSLAASKGQESTAAKAANFALPAAVAGSSAAAEASGVDLLAAFSRSLGGGFAALGALAAGFVLLSTSPAGAGEDELVHQLGLGNISPATKRGEKGEQPETAPTEAPAKVVPNPYGKKGGPAHQAGVKAAEAELKAKYADDPSVRVDTEVKVDTPAGEKKTRYLDVGVVGGDPRRLIEGVQVGKTTQSGIPVARERSALRDIGGAEPWAKLGFRDSGKR